MNDKRMTAKEAVDHLKMTLASYKERCNSEWCNKDREALDVLDEAAEKQMGKNVVVDEMDVTYCPDCNNVAEDAYGEYYKYCPNCGQHINWNEEGDTNENK